MRSRTRLGVAAVAVGALGAERRRCLERERGQGHLGVVLAEGTDDQRCDRLPGAEGRSRQVHGPDRHQGQLGLRPVGLAADQDRRSGRGTQLLRRRGRRRLVEGRRVLRDQVVHAAQQVLPALEREVSVPAGAVVHPQRSADGYADGRLAAGHDHQREGPQGSRRHQGPDDARPVRDRPQGGRLEDVRQASAGHPVRRGRGPLDLLVRDDRRVRRQRAERQLQAGVHLALVAGLQGDDLDGQRLQERPRAQGEPERCRTTRRSRPIRRTA